jgi:hypothetical protein
LLDQYPEKTWEEIVMGLPAPKEDQPQDVSIPKDEDPLDRFSDFKVS